MWKNKNSIFISKGYPYEQLHAWKNYGMKFPCMKVTFSCLKISDRNQLGEKLGQNTSRKTCQNTSFLLFILIKIDAKFWDWLSEIETLLIRGSIIIDHRIIITENNISMRENKKKLSLGWFSAKRNFLNENVIFMHVNFIFIFRNFILAMKFSCDNLTLTFCVFLCMYMMSLKSYTTSIISYDIYISWNVRWISRCEHP